MLTQEDINSSMYGNGFSDIINSLYNAAISKDQKYKGERHIKMYPYNDKSKRILSNFTGPGTRIDLRMEDEPINEIDEESKTHDIEYDKATKKLDKKQIDKDTFKKEIWKADDKFIKNVLSNNVSDPVMGKIAANSIRIKKNMEQKNIIDTKIFSGRGKQKDNPAHILMKYKEKNTRGGLLPLAIPILSAVISGLTSVALDKLISHFMGNGIVPKTKAQKINMILEYAKDNPMMRQDILSKAKNL